VRSVCKLGGEKQEFFEFICREQWLLWLSDAYRSHASLNYFVFLVDIARPRKALTSFIR
jgi:hypothetical protein